MHQRGGETTKKYKILTNGEASEEIGFAKEVARTLEDYETTNQYSVGTLKEQIKQKDLLIRKL